MEKNEEEKNCSFFDEDIAKEVFKVEFPKG